jgi:hypothetical protein
MREQQSVRPAPPRRMSAKQMNSSLLSGIFNGCNGSRPGIDRISGLYPGLITVGASPSAKKRPVIRRR